MGADHIKSDKISSVHTTFIEAAVPVIKELVKADHVRNVRPGVIESGLKPSQSGQVSMKLTLGNDCLKLNIRQAISVQEIYIYTSDVQAANEIAARAALDAGYHIHFDKREVNEVNLRARPSSRDRR